MAAVVATLAAAVFAFGALVLPRMAGAESSGRLQQGELVLIKSHDADRDCPYRQTDWREKV
ncbi:MAG: hypothetical protein H0U03_13050 [Actinobacteria bacterium]|nr:hypothetical protein [Actinomycetota bacterium]